MEPDIQDLVWVPNRGLFIVIGRDDMHSPPRLITVPVNEPTVTDALSGATRQKNVEMTPLDVAAVFKPAREEADANEVSSSKRKT